LARREESKPTRLGLDETSFQKRHEYVTVVTDLDRGCVVAVLDGRTGATMEEHFSGVAEASREAVEVVATDRWRSYLNAARKWLPNAKVCFDRVHVAQHLGDAANTVRKEEHRRLLGEGDRSLAGTKYLWLEGPRKMRRDRRLEL
jgi:transposase